jgi:V8-like Glu-specific endopeptidase
MTTNNPQQEEQSFEHEKWQAEKAFRERELSIKEREQVNGEAELELKRKEQASSGWRSPLVVAIIAATMAAVGNAVVSIVNGNLQRQLENQKSEQTRILEMIKTNNPDKAAENLGFLLEAGLISDPEQQTKLKQFLATRKPGTGPSLPSQAPQGTIGGITGTDDAVDVKELAEDSSLKKQSVAVGQIKVLTKDNMSLQCTAFLIGDDLALTASFCIEEASSAELSMPDGSTQFPVYRVNLPPLEIVSNPDGLNYALLRVDGKPGVKHGVLRLSSQPPAENQSLSLLMFRGSNQKLAITGTPDCRVFKVEQDVFRHRCDTGGGSSGAPILSADGNQVVGLHFQSGAEGGVAVRIDRLLSQSKILQSGR